MITKSFLVLAIIVRSRCCCYSIGKGDHSLASLASLASSPATRSMRFHLTERVKFSSEAARQNAKADIAREPERVKDELESSRTGVAGAHLTEWRGEGSVVLVRVAEAAGVGWSGCVGLERSTLGVVVRGGGRGVVRWGRFAAGSSSSSIDAAVVSVVLAGLQSEVVLLLAAVRVVLVL